MVISSESPHAQEAATMPASSKHNQDEAAATADVPSSTVPSTALPPTSAPANKAAKDATSHASTAVKPHATPLAVVAPSDPKQSAISQASSDTAVSSNPQIDAIDPTNEFDGEVNTNHEIPPQDVLRQIENCTVLDKDGKTVLFKNIISGSNSTRRVMVIFIRHFYCGNCQEYIRALTASISPSQLLSLPIPTFIAIIGCGDASLIGMYEKETKSPFPVYADPTKKLYDALDMIKTLDLGTRPEYQRKNLVAMAARSFLQSVRKLPEGLSLKGGDMNQVGGEFMFEPMADAEVGTPIQSPDSGLGDDSHKQLGANGFSKGKLRPGEEEKRITWCHRMRNTRDHAEIPELMEVLGLPVMGDYVHGKNGKRWARAIERRKGTGLSDRTSGSLNRQSERDKGRNSDEKSS